MIPAEAVEAAAKAGYEYQYSSLEGMWEFANPRVQEDFRREFRAALEAAAPYMWQEGYERGWGAGFRHTSQAYRPAAERAPYMLNTEGEK